MPCHIRPSLRDYLQAAPPGSQIVAYLTIGDPPQRFIETADEVLQAGALTLELGFPHPKPAEGPLIAASHQRAVAAGVTTELAMQLLKSITERHPQTPLVALVQWPSIDTPQKLAPFLDGLVKASAAAILPVGLPQWQLSTFADEVHARALQTVLPCPPNGSQKFRQETLRCCSGCLYVPRGRHSGAASRFVGTAEFCELLRSETELPIIMGIGVKTAADVAEICRTPAQAAAVGTALVEHIAQGGSPGAFVRRLLQPSDT